MQKSFFLLMTTVGLSYATQIKSINFEGLEYLSQSAAREISGLKIGDEITGENSNRAIKNLFNQGYFNDVYMEESNGNIIIHVDEKKTIARIDLNGVASNDKDVVKQLIGIKPGQMYDEFVAKNIKEKIKRFYEAKGYFDTNVEIQEKSLKNKKSIQIIVNVNKGENITIRKVNLEGAKVLDYDDIEPVVSNKQREALGFLWGFNDGKVKLQELPNDKGRIQEEYYKKGYLDASVSEPFLKADMDNYSADLTYFISEGNQYKINEISIDAPDFLELNTKEILDDFKLEKGDVINSVWVRKDIKMLEDIVADKGYAYVKVLPQTRQDKEKNLVDIKYKVIPGEKVYIRNVTISGNSKTADKVIRREMYLTEANLYNRTDLEDSRRALKRTGYFDDVQVKETRVGPNQIDLNVEVKEAPTGTITGGIGYGSSDGLLLNAGISDRNIFGTGMKGEFIVDKSDDALSGRISLTNPRVFDSRYSLGGSIYANDFSWNDYDEKSYGFSLTTGRKIGRHTNISLTYQLEQSKIDGLDEFYQAAGYQDGKNIKSSIIPSIVFNNTDDYFIPRSGIIAKANLEYAGLGGDMKFAKARGNFNWYFGLKDYIDWDVIFRYKAGVGYIWKTGNDENLPVNERLFLGGLRTVRGFDNRSIPKKEYCLPGKGCKHVEVGGLQSFNTSAELSFPLIERLKMRLVGFFDYGTIGQDSWNEEERYSTGGGIEWITPVGPLQLYFIKPLNEKKYDDTSSFEFTIGHSF